MNRNEKPSLLKGKGIAVGIVICFVAVIAVAGAYTFNNYQKQIDEQMAKAEQQAEELARETEETTTDDIVLPEEEEAVQEEESDTETPAEVQTEETDSDTDETAVTGDNTSGVWFSEDSILEWPASGAVIMSYSMDGEIGETIGASAAGIVTNIEQTAQTGTTVTLDMGNGYTAVYGQLKEVPVSVGDYVGTGETVGYLSEPTKYYSVEGPNLYFEVLKDGEPVDPTNYME